MIMETKTSIRLSDEESKVLAKAREILEEIAEKVNKIDGEVEFDDDEDYTNIDEIARFSKDISDITY